MQFLLATIPFLILFSYFLYLAYMRPSLSVYQLDNAAEEEEIEQAMRETGAIIPLMDMVGCFLAFLGLFSMLFVYLAIFVAKRRQLMKSYLESGDSVLGDVFYEGNSHKCGTFSEYAHVMYAHPNHPKQWLVRKRIRIYQAYTRERTTVLILPNYPFSGQPKTDVEMDLASSEESRRDTNTVVYCLVGWIIFLLLAPIYLIHQMGQIEDDYDDPQRGWKIYLICVLGAIPVLAFGGNWLRWRFHRHWVLNRGVVIELQKTSGVDQVRVAQGDCGALACMGYKAMEEEEEGGIASPTNTEVSQATAYNSVYMA
jgi:hypothetical protein